MKNKIILSVFFVFTTILVGSHAQNSYPTTGTVKVTGSGNYNTTGASSVILENSVASKSWQWHALDDGGMQLGDMNVPATRFLIDATGNIGIGTITPSYKLTISGSGAYNATGASSIVLENSVANKSWQWHVLDDGGMQLGDMNVPATRFLIDATGNIGIGTITPSHKLTISGSGAYNATGASSIVLENSVANKSWQWHVLDDGAMQFGDYNTSATRFLIDANGNVGIGSITPGAYKLAVNGKIRAKEVKIETGWSDFVFEDDYELPTLAEVESFIKANKHLPEIPSAKEVAENGVNVGEMESKLLQKIEELTLYIIEQEKRIKKLEAGIAD
ncbi:hypothetical protein QQ020_26635 [Fulvivirgaceae bacterium BMA12]|uniref:Uncharacterized protein n=1 Tax=Agaribacillus aureus TaxID=3051825 RepID=A0ABT8LD23_9BACT|nr:hypothetical protein [Fulvivirgaceae bacterium BMA12]